MGVNVSGLTITVPGHIVRRTKGSDTELQITGEQGKYILDSLTEVRHLLPDDAALVAEELSVVAPEGKPGLDKLTQSVATKADQVTTA